jgi:hypothetical protein
VTVENAHVAENLSRMDDNDRETYIQAQVRNVSDAEELLPRVQEFTDISTIFSIDGHILISGKTGSGKTTLQMTVIKKFLDNGTVVLHRDDGGLEFIYLAAYVKTRIFIPDDPNVTLELIGFDADIVKFKSPEEIVDAVWQYDYPYNVIVYDVFCLSSAQKAKFYSQLFFYLIFMLQQKRKSEKRHVVFSIDELNDLIPPRGKGSPEFAITRADVELNIRKIRKHKVKLIATSHRFNQIGLDTRSQFEIKLIKKCYGYDIWSFLSQNLISSNNKTFWRMMKRVLTMPRNEFIMFDENNFFDRKTYPDIPRDPALDIEALGSLPMPNKESKSDVAMKKHAKKLIQVCHDEFHMSYDEIGKKAGISHQQISNIVNSKEEPYITA